MIIVGAAVEAARLFRAPVLQINGWVLRADAFDGLGMWDHPGRGLRTIHSIAEHGGDVWVHVSFSRRDGKMPTWEEAQWGFRQVMGPDALGLIVIAPESEHVNKAEVSHVWHCLTRRPTPDFTEGTGSI